MDDPMAIVVVVEDHMSALSGFRVEFMTEDLQMGTKAYKEDKSHIAAYTKLFQGQKYQDVYLTSSGLMARMGGSIEDHCSLVLAAKHIEGMPRCALHRPHGHAQDPEISG